MPSSRHVVVVQDIYDAYGNPRKQISDNGPPFNSEAMKEFTTKRHIAMQKIPPLHRSANPVETFMKPLGKTMKIANYTRKSEDSLRQLLSNHRETPHPATGVAPASRFFRDGQLNVFPRVSVSDDQVRESIQKDIDLKQNREEEINSSKFRQSSEISVGDTVMMRNHRKQSKSQPTFLPEAFKVVNVSQDGRILVIARKSDGAVFRRHPDDVKIFDGEFPKKDEHLFSEKDELEAWHGHCSRFRDHDEYNEERENAVEETADVHVQAQPRRSERVQQRNQKYYNDDFET